ncbi:hypothetical protein CAEBREN_30035 [Caenorhabditis brenneri]|uniref:Uncharacterized protein n=1 Tax=Caenorhabditis brenneri TaxID=135651 RepID=G0PHE1_CAEBE|nr:hypothetical protein CAEBREN_30035 [Caenorhabditis brenneri]
MPHCHSVLYLLQFVFISLFYVFTWVLFEILPHIVPDGQTEWYLLVPIFATINCTSNSIIYMTVNTEVQKSLRAIFNIPKVGGAKVSSVGVNTTDG